MPVLVLQKLSSKIGPTYALLLALLFPLAYGAYDYLKTQNKNWISVLGVVNTLFTGGFALLKVGGIWFAVKEAAFPLIIGIAVLVSIFLKTPAMEKLFFNPTIFNIEVIKNKIQESNKKTQLAKLFETSTYLLASSFFLSSFLNFSLAVFVFTELPKDVTGDQQTVMLNDQIAQMTWLSFVVIVLPLMVFMAVIFWHFIRTLKTLTGLTTDELLVLK